MQKIAIIGASALFPGSSTPDEFWQNLLQKKDLTGLATKKDFGANPDHFFHPEKGVVDKCYSLRGGYIRDFQFDPTGYELPADFLAKQDKLYQWSLYVAKEALRHSGYLTDTKSKGKCGLVLGNLSFPTGSSHRLLSSVYTQTMERAVQELLGDERFKMTINQPLPDNEILEKTPSQMVNDALGLNGSNYALDAACATSLYAIKLACDELVTGKSDMMLAGAVCASDQLFIHIGFSIFHAYSADNQKFVPLDKDSAGLVSSEGAGMVVLKRLEDAERDSDNILAVIGGIGLSNDGRGKFLLSPNPKGQRLAFERAYQNDISAKNTDYLECHATGTPLGDTTEMNSISNFFTEHQNKPLLGSVKSNMGHLLTAAGMTGLLKVLLAMQNNKIPPNINLQEAVKADNDWMGREQMITSTTSWTDADKQAGINSFGFGGTNAHLVVQNHTKNLTDLRPKKAVELQPMAIVGMDAHFGNCTNLTDFHTSIYQGKQHFRELPKERWKGFEENENLLKEYGFADGKAPKGAYIDDFEIDLFRYKIQPKEAETLEPQQALILKIADNALHDAGLSESQNVAVLIAMESELSIHHYLGRWDVGWQLKEALQRSEIELTGEQKTELETLCKNGIYFREGTQTPSQHTSFVGNIMASRISALWDFSGASFTISAGENSVFKALEVAQNLLSLGEVEAVVLGGVDFSGGLENVLLRNQKNAVNANENPSLSFNKNDHGWLIGEGAGAVVLKKKSDITDEKVYAVIEGIGQQKAVADIGYLELSATGIAEQDEKEKTFLLKNKPAQKVAVGSVKTNIGHTFAASGIASLIKTALCVYHRFIPGIPNWEAPKAAAEFAETDYYFPTNSRPWILLNGQTQRQAAINGAGNFQIQLSEYQQIKENDTNFLRKSMPHLFALKGNNAAALQQQLSALEIAVETELEMEGIAGRFYERFQKATMRPPAPKGEPDSAKLNDSFSNQNSIESFAIIAESSKLPPKNSPLGAGGRIALIAKTKNNLLQEIQFFKNNLTHSFEKKQILKTPRGSYFTPNPLEKKGKTAFVYPGSATAYTGLGQDLFQLFPSLLTHFEQTIPNIDDYIWSDYLFPKLQNTTTPPPNIYENAIAMMSSGVFYSVAFTQLLQSVFKVKSDLAMGYSMGECSSMWYALEVWQSGEAREFQESPIFKNRFAGNLELLAEHWGISSEEARECWISMVLLAPKSEVEKLLKQADKVYLTFINTDKEVVISGDKTTCLAIAEKLHCQKIVVPFQNVIHHDFCRKEEAGLLKMHNFELKNQPTIDFYSSISHQKIPIEKETIAKNSMAVCAQQVDFPAHVQNVYDAGARIFIEMGANSTCTNWIQTILQNQEHHAVAINQKGKSDAQALVELLAQLVSHGVELDLSVFYNAEEKQQQKTKFLKKIVPGGKRIFDTMLNEESKAKFANLKYKKELVLAEKTANFQSETVAHAVAQPTTRNPQLATRNKMENTLLVQKNKPSTAVAKIGENGLKIHDFSTGKHLEDKDIIFTKADLEEFATGKIANVFGKEYSIIDTYKRRVMLPMNPYLLVSRVTGLKGELGKYEPSTMQTEYDIPHNAWFTTDRQIPWAVSVESGQCDLLLIAYLGIDFQNKGNLVYRLLDCTLTFVDDLPFEGQTLRYDISINSFVKNGENLLFFFSYRCYVEDRLVLKMDGGCAGFFGDKQLEEGNGVVYSEKELAAKRNAKRQYFMPLLHTKKMAFSKDDLRHLINGEPEKCFDDISYFANGYNPSLCLPPEKILMLDRIVSVNLTGGAHGLGYILAEKDLSPDDWFFPCHFRDDEVLAGSLQAEGGGNLLRFFMLMLGLQRLTKDARYQPVFDVPQKVRCRKQVTPTKDTKLVYKLEIKEIGLYPNPYVIGDLEIVSDGVITVHFENLGLQLREKDNPKYLETASGVPISERSKGAVLNEKDITAFALDTLENAFGEDFVQYNGRPTSRQPNTDLQVVSRVLKTDGKRGDFSKPSTFWAEYDVPQDAWYYQQNSAKTMPYSILMEVALQPCGMMGAYLGATLPFKDKNLFFRNLDGEGETFDLPYGTDFGGKTIANKAVLKSSVSLGDTVLQNYTFACSVDDQVFYQGKSSFGFFSKDALAAQVGLDGGKEVAPWYQIENLQPQNYMQIKLDSLYGKMKLLQAPADKPHYRLAGDQLQLIDTLKIAKAGGKFGKGYVHATRFMQPYDWFFTCHFYTDPVMPGSLGVEAMLQTLQVFALQQDLGKDFVSPKFVQLPNHKTQWKYRGQILQTVKEMHLEIHVKTVEMRNGVLAVIGDAYLWNEGMRIYQVTDLGLGIMEA